MSGLGTEAPAEKDLENRLLRIADVLIAAALIFFTFLLMMFVSLAIKHESSGPVLYRRHRVCRNGRQFTLLSFRTTSGDRGAHQTRIGAFLQYSGIADLPQLANVLRGDITLVGRVPATRRVARWTAWVILALLSGALFRNAGSVLEFLE
jgi:lipopolysaccharide/colanic/teichoic acid biosynthesis glycosyltransferase